MSDLTAADLARLEALCAAATPGPWQGGRPSQGYMIYRGGDGPAVAQAVDGEPRPGEAVAINVGHAYGFDPAHTGWANGAFIAASREAVPALVATVRELARAIVGAMEGTAWASCPFCDLTSREGHYPSCAYERARALVGEDRP